jgi:glucose-6-phosphate dehydrogenase assembly protein OpcA
MAAATDSALPGFPVELSPDAIDRELASMWKQRGGEGGDESPGVTRIALGNIIWLTSTRHREHARRVFANLVQHYPSRLILLEYQEEWDNPEVEAFVNAQCFRPHEIRGEVCCEEIVLRFGARAFRHIANAVLSLLLPDVPTTFCYISALPHRYADLIEAIGAIADHTITEATLLDDPVKGLREMAEGNACAGTLSWFRYTPIREQIAAVFDDRHCGALLSSISGVRIKWCGGGGIEALTTASLLVGWMASRLGWKPGAASWPFRFESSAGPVAVEFLRCEPAEEEGEAVLVEIEIRCATGDRVRLLQSERRGFLERVLDGPSQLCEGKPMYVKTRPLDEAQAVVLSLNTTATNPPFRHAARLAAPVLESALKRLNS